MALWLLFLFILRFFILINFILGTEGPAAASGSGTESLILSVFSHLYCPCLLTKTVCVYSLILGIRGSHSVSHLALEINHIFSRARPLRLCFTKGLQKDKARPHCLCLTKEIQKDKITEKVASYDHPKTERQLRLTPCVATLCNQQGWLMPQLFRDA